VYWIKMQKPEEYQGAISVENLRKPHSRINA
jgi:hypothetical protein